MESSGPVSYPAEKIVFTVLPSVIPLLREILISNDWTLYYSDSRQLFLLAMLHFTKDIISVRKQNIHTKSNLSKQISL